MKRFYTMALTAALLSLVMAACSGSAATPAPGEVPAAEPPVTESPATLAPVEMSTPTLAPVDLAGPPMQVGSKYQYVDGSILVAVPGGKFTMGYGNADNPVHDVTVGDFWMYRSKVTNHQYAACVAAGNCTAPDPNDNKVYDDPLRAGNPVVGVNWDQANAYCSWVHGRLPTEAEWEKAARGPDGNIFPWGDAAASCDLLNFNYCVGRTTRVTDYPQGQSHYDVFDMAGNTYEWVADWYKTSYYGESPLEDPLGPELGEKRSVRGSSFGSGADESLSAHRFSVKPVDHREDLGFRCVVEDPAYFAPYCQVLPLYGADINGSPTDDVIPNPNRCEQPGLQVFEDCKTQATYITLDPYPLPSGALESIPGNCVGGPPTYKCTGEGVVSIVPADCPLPVPPGGGSCAPGYGYDSASNTCNGKGPGTRCVAGFEYDPLLQCCMARNAGGNAYALCPPGFFQQGGACVSILSNPLPPVSVSVSFSAIPACDKPGDNGCDPSVDPACQPAACNPATDPNCQPGCVNVTTCVQNPQCTSRPCTLPDVCTTTCQ